jgi:glycogen operon protein
MLLGGDELQRTQGGNNNAWCQDNEISWYDWELGAEQEAHLAFTRRLIRLRAEHPVFRRDWFFEGRDTSGSGVPDVWWFRPDGRRMTQADWRRRDGLTLGVFLNGREVRRLTPQGERLEDDSFLLLFNAADEGIVFTLPPRRFGRRWTLELSTFDPDAEASLFPSRGLVPVDPRTTIVLREAA